MASRVKVTITREKLLKSLNDRIKELSSGEKEVMSPEGKKLLPYLEQCIDLVKKNQDLPRNDNDLMHYYIYRNNPRYNDGRKKTNTSEEMIEMIKKQIKLIELSEDSTFSVGINDELYDLL